MFGMNYMVGLLTLASLESASGRDAECEKITEQMLDLPSLARLSPICNQ
jgi:hypothetical protein